MEKFKSVPLAKRIEESKRIISKYPDRIPVIAESDASIQPPLDKIKYLVPNDLTVGQFIMVLRKRIKLQSQSALFMFINNTIPPTSALMKTVYNDLKSEDNFLYVKISGENCFGKK